MTHRSNLKTLAALLLAGAMLASCGGGDAEAPPPPVGPTPPSSGPDTTPPTLTVADNISAATASGPVTFTFVFSEDVGISFTADDIVVTGGTAGAFTRVSGSQATLVVTPTANATGTMGVSVAASRFTDVAGNANTATASGQQAYDTLIPAVPGNTGTCLAANCVDFSAAGITFGPFENAGGGSVEIVNDPINAANKVVKFVKKPGDGDYFGTTIGGFSAPVVLTSTNKTVTLRVWTPTAGTNFLLKFEGGTGGPAATEKDVVTTKAGEWETLTFVMPDVGTYTTVVLFPNGRSSVSADKTMYVDELKFPAAASGGGGGSSTALITFDETTAPKLTDFGVNGAPPTIATDPAGGANKVLRVVKYALPAPGSEQWAGVTVSTGANDSIPAIPFTASAQTITMRIYSPAVGVRVRMKVENAANPGVSVETDAITTTSGTWETLTFNFANPGTSPPVGGGPTAALNLAQTYNKLSIFSDFGIGNGGSAPLPADRVYYYDDINFVGAPSGGGGGGGGGSASTLTFSSGMAAGNRTVEGGEFGGFSGSNLDGYQCNGQPASCGSGGEITPTVAAADSFFFYYYQTPTPAADLYMGIYVLAPGLTGGLSATGDSPGVQINGQTSIQFKLGQNPEWFSTTTKNFAVDLTLGKRYVVGGNTCRVQLRKIVTPTASAATAYTVALSGFSVVQDCAQGGLTLASALAGSPISQVSFQGAGGGIPLSAGGQTSGANLSVAVGGVYPTTLVLVGGISFAP